MRKILCILIILLAIWSNAPAKGQAGLFVTLADYEKNTPAYIADSTTKLRIHSFFGKRATVTVVTTGKRHSFKKKELYGYTDGERHLYRFYQNEEYLVAEAGNIYIYSQQNNITQTKGFVVVNTYYFSTAPDSKIIKLNAGNLKAAYAGNEKFIELLELCANGAVHEYDSQHKMYKINYIFQKSLNP